MTKITHTSQSAPKPLQTEMIAICSASGGTGKTTVTINLATLLAGRNKQVMVLDGDLQFGDAATAFDLNPSLTITEVAERKDFHNVLNYCTKHETGVELLAAPLRPEHADLITTEVFDSLIDAVKTETSLLLVDTQAGLTERSLQVMDKADRIIIVTTPSIAAMKNTKLMLETLEALGLKQKCTVVVNKWSTEAVIETKEIPELMKMDRPFYLPDDSKYVSSSLDIGIPIVRSNPKNGFSKGIEKIAEELFPIRVLDTKHPSLFNSFKMKVRALRGKDYEFISKNSIKEPGRS